MATQHPSLIVLEALLDAPRKVEMAGSLWTLDKTLCIVAEAEDAEGNHLGERLLNNPLPLSTFIKMCEGLSFARLDAIAAENVPNRERTHSRV